MKVKKNWLEWVVFGLSVVIVAATLGVLLVESMRTRRQPPELKIEFGTPKPAAGLYRIPVTVRNLGDETAEGVHVEVVLNSAAEELERAEFTLAFVPRHSERQGWVVFTRDPRCCTMVGRTVGFGRP